MRQMVSKNVLKNFSRPMSEGVLASRPRRRDPWGGGARFFKPAKAAAAQKIVNMLTTLKVVNMLMTLVTHKLLNGYGAE